MRPHDEPDDPSGRLPPPRAPGDPRGPDYHVERALRALCRRFPDLLLSSVEDLDRELRELFEDASDEGPLPDDPRQRAEIYLVGSPDEDDEEAERDGVDFALAIDPECPVATVLDAQLRLEPEERAAAIERALAVALERAGGPEFLARHRGDERYAEESFAVVRVLALHAATARLRGALDEAIAAWTTLVELSTSDELRYRHDLAAALLERGDVDAFAALRGRHAAEDEPVFAWGAVLAALLRDDEAAALAALDHARAVEPSVGGMLLAPWMIDERADDGPSDGCPDADAAAAALWPAFAARPGAFEWLFEAGEGPPPTERELRLYASLRPAGDRAPVPAWLPTLFAANDRSIDFLGSTVLRDAARARPWLEKLVQRPDLDREGRPGDGFAPAHAAELLGVLRDPAAVPALAEVVGTFDPEGDGRPAAIEALARIGGPAIDALLELFARTAPDASVERLDLAWGLARTRARDERIREALRSVLDADVLTGAQTCASSLDPGLLPDVERLWLEMEVDDESPLSALEEGQALFEAVIELGGAIDEEGRAKIRAIDELAPDAIDDTVDDDADREGDEDDDWADAGPATDPDDLDVTSIRWGEGGIEPRPPAPVEPPRGHDLGRNDPCWCGSGKKYKKCHGGTDATTG